MSLFLLYGDINTTIINEFNCGNTFMTLLISATRFSWEFSVSEMFSKDYRQTEILPQMNWSAKLNISIKNLFQKLKVVIKSKSFKGMTIVYRDSAFRVPVITKITPDPRRQV